MKMAEKRVITDLEERVEQLLMAHERLVAQCGELQEACAALKQANRALEAENHTLRDELARKELAEGLTGVGHNRDKARARVNRLMREIDKCIALAGALENQAARGMMHDER